MFNVMLKVLSPLNSGFFFCNKIYCVSKCHPVLFFFFFFVMPCGHGALGNWHKNADTLAAAIAMSNKLYFVSDPRDLCLLSASIKL